MAIHVVMLRGINVGGRKSIRMENLRASFEALRFRNVRTYVQSGNVIFDSTSVSENELMKKIGEKILRDYGFPVGLIVRSAVQMRKVVRENPFLKGQVVDPSKLHVTFLSNLATKKSLEKMERLNGAPDQYRILGHEVYLYCPGGYGRTKLSNNAIEKALSVEATTRNWNTANTLARISSELSTNQ